MTSLPEATAKATIYTVSCLPDDDIDSHAFALTVEYRGNDRWGVFRNPNCCLGADGEWSWGYQWEGGADEPDGHDQWQAYHEGREKWLTAHRFTEEEALHRAKEAAPHITVNGFTVADALRMQAKRSDA